MFSAWLMDWVFPFSRVSLSCEKNFEGFDTDNPSSFFHDSVIGFSIIIMSDYSNDETCKICGKRAASRFVAQVIVDARRGVWLSVV
mgnify:CR=1 FL=1